MGRRREEGEGEGEIDGGWIPKAAGRSLGRVPPSCCDVLPVVAQAAWQRNLLPYEVRKKAGCELAERRVIEEDG